MIKQRKNNGGVDLLKQSLNPVLARVYQLRGITSAVELERDFTHLIPQQLLLNSEKAAALLAEMIYQQRHIMLVGDFDADGATSTALAVRVLRCVGAAKVSFIVPNRFEYGYGLTPAIVELAAKEKPDLIMTVDNGISSVEGVATAKAFGIKVLITDHHLAGEQLPSADVIVNPNQKGDTFPSKNLAGVGVCFYIMLALRVKLREDNWFVEQAISEPKLANLLDIVALGTVADVVPLDHNNRILVHQGLGRIRSGKCIAGIQALITVAGRTPNKISALDLGFIVAPRLNAAGRLADMSLGIECLLTDDPGQAQALAQELDDLNHERRDIETDMKAQAFATLNKMQLDEKILPLGITLFDPQWHQGVIGIIASRIKDQHHRPTIVFATTGENELKGSARSVRGVHIRDVLDAIAKQHPELITKFGGHAMAAGLSLEPVNFPAFQQAFIAEVAKHITLDDVQGEVFSDGSLTEAELSLATAEVLANAGPWGQGFPEPLFDGVFEVIEQRIVGQKHLRLALRYPQGKKVYPAIKFNIDMDEWPNHRCQQVQVAYRLAINEFNQLRNLQLMVQYIEVVF